MRSPDSTGASHTPNAKRRDTPTVESHKLGGGGLDLEALSPADAAPRRSPAAAGELATPLNKPTGPMEQTATSGGISSLYGGSPSTSAGWPSPPPRSISFGGSYDLAQPALNSAAGKRSNSRSGFRIFCRVDCRVSPHRPIPSREAVCDYFSRYGAILDCYLPESATNVAYVCFEDSQSLEEVMAQERPHVVDGTQLTVTRAQPRPDYSVNTDRVFVKHVPDNATRMDLRTYFTKFGEVTDVYIPKDKATGAQRRFAFVTFREVRSARAALGAGRHTVLEQEVQVMPAEARPQAAMSQNSPRPSPSVEPMNRTIRSHTDSILLPPSMSATMRPSTTLVPYLPPPEEPRHSHSLPPTEMHGDYMTQQDVDHMAALASSVSNLLDSSPSSAGNNEDNADPENMLKRSLRRAVQSEERPARRSFASPFANAMSPLLSFEDTLPTRLPPSVVDQRHHQSPAAPHSPFVL